MQTNLRLGSYVNLQSVISRLPSTYKLLFFVTFVISTLVATNVYFMLTLVLMLIVIIFLSRLPFSRLLIGLKSIFPIICINILINFTTLHGRVILEFLGFYIYEDALITSLIISIKLIVILFSSEILLMSTKVLDLITAMSLLLSPLRRFGLDVDEFSFVVVNVFYFLPLVFDESKTIISSQQSRGASKNILSLLVPLFSRALRISKNLSYSMYIRGLKI